EDGHSHLEKPSICVCVLQKFPARLAEKELRVFLIGETVGRNVIGLEGDSCLQCGFPLLNSLTRQSEHEINIDARESGSSQDMERLFGLLRVVLPPQELQQFIIPRLNAETDPVYPELAKNRSFARRHAPGVRLDRPFCK